MGTCPTCDSRKLEGPWIPGRKYKEPTEAAGSIKLKEYRDAGRECQPPFLPLSARSNRVVPLDNFMIYKDIIRLDRPD